MDRFQAFTAFAKVVETGSFARAAERLEVSVSAISRQVADLESHLDARLLNRTTRRLSLTESGRVFYERCVQLLADLEEVEESASLQTVKPRGTLRLTCAVTFGERHLAPVIADFLLRYPEMKVAVELSDRTVDLVDEGFDAALRIGLIESQNLIGRKVGETRMICCAAPSYLERRGTPRGPQDLTGHTCLTYEYAPQRNIWPFLDEHGAPLSIRVGGPAHANSGHFLTALAVSGIGVAYEPDFIVGPELRAGRLVPLLQDFRPVAATIFIVYPSRRHLSAKVRAFVDYVAERFAEPTWPFERVSARLDNSTTHTKQRGDAALPRQSD